MERVVEAEEADAMSRRKSGVVSLMPTKAAEIINMSPEVTVDSVRLPEVAVTLLAPVPSMEKVPVASMSYVPVTSMSRLFAALMSTSPAEVMSSSPEVIVES